VRYSRQKYGVKVLEMNKFDPGFISQLKSPLYLSLDLDVLDPAFAPGVSHHEPGGLSTRQLLEIIQTIPAKTVGADIVEYNPVRDVHNVTAMVAYKLFKEIISIMLKN
jgi:arginase